MLERKAPGPASSSQFSCSKSWPETLMQRSTEIGKKQAPEHPPRLTRVTRGDREELRVKLRFKTTNSFLILQHFQVIPQARGAQRGWSRSPSNACENQRKEKTLSYPHGHSHVPYKDQKTRYWEHWLPAATVCSLYMSEEFEGITLFAVDNTHRSQDRVISSPHPPSPLLLGGEPIIDSPSTLSNCKVLDQQQSSGIKDSISRSF